MLKKLGFTLAEMLITLAIMGIICGLTLSIVKPQTNTIKYQYSNAYSSISKAYYNGIISGYDPFAELPGENSYTDVRDIGALRLCQGLSKFINSTDTDFDAEDQDYSTSCSDTKLTSIMGDSFTDDNVQFISAANNMKFYITKRHMPLQVNMESEAPFYIIFVDINGDRRPNRMDYPRKADGSLDTKQTPDIFAFAALKTGMIVPLGLPEYDTNILTARIAYRDAEGNEQYTTDSVAYYQAKGQAWGFYQPDTNAPESLMDVLDSEPFSMSDHIRWEIRERFNSTGVPNSLIVRDFPTLMDLEPNALDEENRCRNLNYESCYVILDNYVY